MAFREVRIREARNRLAFRFDAERDVVEVMINGQRYEVALHEYRPLHRRQVVGVNFAHIDHREPLTED
jgi:hypothetical protein